MGQNIGIVFFSRVHTSVDERNGEIRARVVLQPFVIEEGLGIFHGFQTNEAPLANIMDLLAVQGQQLDRLYCLVTPQCISSEEWSGGEDRGLHVIDGDASTPYVSQFAFWCARMKELRPMLADVEIIPIPLKYREDALVEDIEGQIASLAARIKGDAGVSCEWSDCHIYADITGGPRYVNMMMTSVLQFLQYDGMRVEKMIYADNRTLSRQSRIYDVRAVGDIYKLVAGADAFVSYGSSRAIEEYFCYDPDTDEAETAIGSERKTVLRAMRAFSDAIQICQTKKIPSTLLTLSTALQAFSEMSEEVRMIEDRIFMQLIDTIRAGYGELLDVPQSRAQHYAAIIRWCVDKGLLQQAMTLATEWIPVILIERQIVYPTPALHSFAEAAVGRMHPNWEQNFIINPTDYQNRAYEKRKAEAVKVLKRAVEEGRVPSDAPPILRTIQRVHQLFLRILGNSNRADAFAKAPEEVKEIYRLVCDQLNSSNRTTAQWTIKSLLYNRKARDTICGQICKKDGIFVRRLLHMDPPQTEAGKTSKWATRRAEWDHMMHTQGLVQTDTDVELMMDCLQAHFELREQRNQINHATEKNDKSRKEVIALVSRCLASVDAAVASLHSGKE